MDYNFDRVASSYDETRALPEGVSEAICRWVLARLPADPAVAEIGVGTGRIAIPFIERGIRYTGFDISEQMTTLLWKKLGGHLRRAQILLADVTEHLPVDDQSQDAVIAVHILHLVDVVPALTQIRRVLKPGGALVWGYEWYDDLALRIRIRNQFSTFAAEHGAPARRDFLREDARTLLSEWGARGTRHVVAAWTETETCRQVLDKLRNRMISFTWELDDTVLQKAAEQTEAWARSEYGDLDRAHPVGRQFIVDWYQF